MCPFDVSDRLFRIGWWVSSGVLSLAAGGGGDSIVNPSTTYSKDAEC
jgi:hypothetical protein